MSQLEVDKIIPQSGTTLTIGDSGDTVNFADGTSIGIDTNTLYIDSTNNRVGIGTSSPGTTLDVATSNDTIAQFQSTTNGSDVYIELRSPNDAASSKAGQIFFDPDTNTIGFRNGNINVLHVDNSERIGIGTSSPGRQFEISSTNPYLSLKSTDTSTGTSQIFFGDTTDDNVGRINYQHSDNSMLFLTSATEAMRIDSSGNVMVGTTDSTPASSSSGSGISLRENGSIEASRDGSAALFLNRQTSDGKIIDLYKDGTQVGSIGVAAGDNILLEATATDHAGINLAANAIVPRQNGSGSDNGLDLGGSGNRFKDLYLGGGLYVGGTGTANKLDDYEEGTFTPSITDGIGNRNHTVQLGQYTKIGNVCKFKLRVALSAGTANANRVAVGGLPFTSAGTTGDGVVMSYASTSVVNSTTTNLPTMYIGTAQTSVQFYKTDGSDFTGNDLNSASSANFYIAGTYITT